MRRNQRQSPLRQSSGPSGSISTKRASTKPTIKGLTLPDQVLGRFATERADAPIHVFIHGGAGKFGSAAQNHYLAETCAEAGVHFIAPDFSPVRDSEGNLAPMVDQLRQALVWIHHIARISCPFFVAYGSFETPEFQRQAREFAAALEKKRVPTTLIRLDGYNHFEAIETLANPLSPLSRAALAQIRSR